MAAGKARMADDRHRELATAAVERTLEPCPLPLINPAQDAGIDGEQREILGLQLEKRRPLASRP